MAVKSERLAEIDSAVLKNLAQVSSWKSVASIFSLYVLAFLLIWGVTRHTQGWMQLGAGVLVFWIIAAIQNNLITFLHDGAHHLIHPNRQFNNFIADTFCGMPFFTLLKNYRHFHLNHHKFSGDPELDPEPRFYAAQGYHYERRSRMGIALLFFKDLIGINIAKSFSMTSQYLKKQQEIGKLEPLTFSENTHFALVWIILIGGTVSFGVFKEFLLFWVLPGSTGLYFLLKLHGYGEHTGAQGPTEYQRTWIHDFDPVSNFFIYPIHSGLHMEHHLFPMVPWYNLHKLRRELLKAPAYFEQTREATLTSYFFGKKSVVRAMLLDRP